MEQFSAFTMTKSHTNTIAPSLETIKEDNNTLRLKVKGTLNAYTTANIWNDSVAELKKSNREDIMVVAGGVIPKQDYDYLYDCGVTAIFGPGTVISQAARNILEILINNLKQTD